MPIPFMPILIGSIINAIPVLALYFAVSKNIKRLAPLVLFSIVYSAGNSLYWISNQVNLTLIITFTVLVVVGLICLYSILRHESGRLKSWFLASSALILCSVIPFVRLSLFLEEFSPTFFYPLIAALLAVGIVSLAFARGTGGPLTNGTAYPNGTITKTYATQTEIDTDLAIKGRSVLSDPNLDEGERARYRQALDEKDNG